MSPVLKDTVGSSNLKPHSTSVLIISVSFFLCLIDTNFPKKISKCHFISLWRFSVNYYFTSIEDFLFTHQTIYRVLLEVAFDTSATRNFYFLFFICDIKFLQYIRFTCKKMKDQDKFTIIVIYASLIPITSSASTGGSLLFISFLTSSISLYITLYGRIAFFH